MANHNDGYTFESAIDIDDGGAVTQASTSGRATGVTLSKVTGKVTTDDASLAAALDILEDTLGSDLGNMRGDYVCGQYTFADCAWAGVCQVATNSGKGNAVSSRARVNKWFAAVQSHPSTSKESINPFSCMCTKADADGGTIRNISINAG